MTANLTYIHTKKALCNMRYNRKRLHRVKKDCCKTYILQQSFQIGKYSHAIIAHLKTQCNYFIVA